MKEKDKIRLNIDLPPEAHRRLKVYAAYHEKNMGEVLSDLISKYLTIVEASEKKYL